MLTKKIILVIIILPLLYLFYLLAPASFSGEQIRFVIPLEENREEIVSRLREEKFIRSEKLFNLFHAVIFLGKKIEPGAYMLSRRNTALDILNTLINHAFQKWVVLPPGLRTEQTGEKLQEKFKWDNEKLKDFLANAREGYMFPDTYLINVDYAGKEVAQKLLNNFNEKFDAQLQKDLLSQDVRNDTAIKIASLIERESGSNDDKALIAGIIWNRLNEGMKLQIDACNQYILGKSGDWWPRVKGDDMKVDSPYNTYLYKGLPPAPICNPSLASIKAAVYPAETDCLFYLHDAGKQIHCSKTYEEHLENIEKYLK